MTTTAKLLREQNTRCSETGFWIMWSVKYSVASYSVTHRMTQFARRLNNNIVRHVYEGKFRNYV